MEWREKYQEELKELRRLIQEMGELAISQIELGLKAAEDGDEELAATVKKNDEQVDAYQIRIEDLGTKLIAMEQPVAGDLREIVSSIKIVSSIERIADHAKHLAKGSWRIYGESARAFLPTIREMAEKANRMLEKALKAFSTTDAQLAREVAMLDEEVDELKRVHSERIIRFMQESPDNVEAGASLLFLNRFMERMGDHVTNICEWVYFTATGEHIELN